MAIAPTARSSSIFAGELTAPSGPPAGARRRALGVALSFVAFFSCLLGLAVVASASAATSSSVRSRLAMGAVLRAGQSLTSANREYSFAMQGDDNAVEYLTSDEKSIPSGALWATGTSRGAGHEVEAAFSLDTRCRPYLFDVKTTKVMWRANKVPLGTRCYLLLQNDGDLADFGYTAGSPDTAVLLWQSATATNGAGIAALAVDQLGDHNCSVNSLGTVGFGSTDTAYNSCDGSADPQGEYWCADFASWVWEHAVTDGFDTVATYTDPNYEDGAQQSLSPWAPNFARYGWAHGTFAHSGTPVAGDVVVLSNDARDVGGKLNEHNVDSAIEHVAIVVSVHGKQMSTVSGDWGGTGSNEAFWTSSSVAEVQSTFAVGSSYDDSGLVVAGWVAPVVS